jgi:integrase
MRADEILRLTWDKISSLDRCMTLEAEYTKINKPRSWPVSELSPPKCKKVEASFLCSLSQLGLTYLLAVSL